MTSAPNVIWLEAGATRLGVVPRLGGRMLSMRVNGYEFLWRNPTLLGPDLALLSSPIPVPPGGGFSDWQNWGGDKTWPAPQGWSDSGQWAGPPDDVLDAGLYAVVDHRGDRISMVSGRDPRGGLVIARDIRIRDDGSVTVTSTLTNKGPEPARWSAWEVAQLPFVAADLDDSDTGIEVHTSGEVAPRVLFSPVGIIGSTTRSGVVTVSFTDAVGKIGFPDALGRVRFKRVGFPTLVLEFDVDPRAPYPDGCSFQLWMQTPQHLPLPGLEELETTAALVELEAMSPLADLGRGQSVRLQTRWRIEPTNGAPTSGACTGHRDIGNHQRTSDARY